MKVHMDGLFYSPTGGCNVFMYPLSLPQLVLRGARAPYPVNI